MTNYEKIKSMSVEEMVDEIFELCTCRLCIYKKYYDCEHDCIKGITRWLESEVEDA